MARSDRAESVYLDACCYIDWAEGKISADKVETWIRAARRGHVRIFASTVMFAEARGTGNGVGDVSGRKKVRALLQEPSVTLVDATRRVGLLAHDIALEMPRIKGMDAVHMASAVFAEAKAFLSRDVKHFPVGQSYRGVWVDEPYEFGGEGLFAPSLVT